jgi:hypothetical protein
LLAGCLSIGLESQSMATQSAEATSRAESAQKYASDLREFDGELRTVLRASVSFVRDSDAA